jgi:NhaP-type Na+/H+ or K+/H+ antiporter
MKEVGASKRLGHLIDGEALLNDGSAYVFFLVFYEMIKGVDRSAGGTVGYFFELVCVACAVGCAFGLVLTIFLALVYRCELNLPCPCLSSFLQIDHDL